MQRVNRTVDSELAYTLQRVDVERLTTALIGCSKDVTREEADKIRRFVLEMQKDPTAQVSPEFMDLDIVRRVMKE